MSVLLDAGPSLNFLAVRQENVLIQAAESANLDLAVPARVEREILGVCQDARFRRSPAETTWHKLRSAGRIRVLDDALATTPFVDAVTRISGQPAHDRIRTGRSLGEIMVLAHASVLVQQGHDIFVLIDESDGRVRAHREIAWLQENKATGRLTLWSTPQVLKQASGQTGWIKHGLTWQAAYGQMRQFDDGLPDLKARPT
jgi:hypothetical protein